MPGTLSQPTAASDTYRLSVDASAIIQWVNSGRRNLVAGISLGGIIVIIGIILMIVWSFWLGLIVVLIGLIAFGGFARGRWY
jgi:fatty acid desaturase